MDGKSVSFAEMMPDDVQVSREERSFRLWINSLGIASYVNNMFEDVRNGYVYFVTLIPFLHFIHFSFKINFIVPISADGFFWKFLTKYLQDRLYGSRPQNLQLRCLSEKWKTATKLFELESS